jgi:hypothetical protein
MDGKEQAQGQQRERSRFWLWYAFLGAPTAWALHIGARYPLLPPACRADAVWLLHGVTVGCLLLALGSFAAAARVLARARTSETRGAEAGRLALFAKAGVLFGVLFAGVIAAELLPTLVVDPCLGVGQGREQR